MMAYDDNMADLAHINKHKNNFVALNCRMRWNS